MLGFVGETWIEESDAEVTVSVVLPDIAPNVAVTVVEPAAMEVASPVLPTAAIRVVGVLHVTESVSSWFDPSE